MDPNLLLWKSEGQSFFQRLRSWLKLLDPILLLSSDAEIQKAQDALLKQNVKEKDESAVILLLSSARADSGAPLPLIFRPPAFLPVAGPLVAASLVHHQVRPALFWQFLLHSYGSMFTHANRNSSGEQEGKSSLLQPLVQPLLIIGSACYATCVAVFPQIYYNRSNLRSSLLDTIFKFIIPIPHSAAGTLISVSIVRFEEVITGIRVFDSNGNYIGVSKAAGKKAVWETAVSRATLLGTTTAVPNLLILRLRRTRLFQRYPLLVTPCYYVSMAIVFGLMVPVSFSLFPQLGTINRKEVEDELQAKVVGGELYYHRGL